MRRNVPLNSKVVPHEYRDQAQQELDAHHRRSVVMSSLLYAAELEAELELDPLKPNVSDIFFDLVDAIDLWDDVVDILRKRQRPGDAARIAIVELHRARRAGGDSGETAVTR